MPEESRSRLSEWRVAAGHEQALARIEALHALSLDLTAARSPEDVCQVLLRHALRATGGRRAVAWYLDGTRRTVAGSSVGVTDAPAPDLAAFAASWGTGARTTRPWLSDELTRALRGAGPERIRTATLHAGGSVVGALALAQPDDVVPDDPRLFGPIVRLAGEALARARSVGEALRLASIMEASGDALMATATDGTILAWNRAAERVSGFTAAEVVGRNVSTLAPGGRLDEKTAGAVARLRAGGGVERLEVERMHRDGRRILLALTLSPMRDDRGELTCISATARDITAQRSAEQRLVRLAAAVEHSPSATVVIDAATDRIAECNPAALRMLRLDRSEVLGRPSSMLESGPDCNVVGPLGECVARGESFFRDPVWRVNADGSTLRLRVTGYPVPGDDGGLTATVIVMEDVTERAGLEEALRRAQRLEALGRLAGGVAHDVNNMLTVIAGYAQIARSYVGGGRGAEALDEVGSATKRVQGLTRQLLAFARRQSVEPASLDLAEVMDSLLPMLRSLVGGAVRLTFEAAPSVPPVRADRAQIEQVVVNLVVNARDAMPDGGEVVLALRTEGDTVVLEVADTGEGMSRDTAEQIFEPFFSTKDAATSEHGGGTGLGLAIVHGAVSQAGGEIEVHSTQGDGTRFVVWLPADRDTAQAAGAPAPAAAAADPPRAARILVCEDEPVILRLLTRFLEDGGYQVTPVSDPRDAIDVAASAAPFDLLVTDVLMPGMSGPQLAERIVGERAAAHVVFISGFVDDSFTASEGVADGVLVGKPFTAAELLAAVRSQLDDAGPP
jgi:two-component system, cell cycle sensor histidine kinase and response regulator CckA